MSETHILKAALSHIRDALGRTQYPAMSESCLRMIHWILIYAFYVLKPL